MMAETRAVVLLSGGLDSATVLALARADGRRCFALSIDYGQRHGAELAAARTVATQLGAVEHRVVSLDLAQFGGSSLTDLSLPVPVVRSSGIPSTYVPARNTIFLAIASAWAEVLAATEIHIGVNAVDYSGYPDCRAEFIAAFATVIALGTKRGLEGVAPVIRTPLVALSKAEIIHCGVALGVDYGLTVSCYQANDAGRACGRCDACELRRAGFASAEIKDPTLYQTL